ncbi:MAG: hypothetical protein AB1668_00640 [Nanoarchaeota archaeon]
MPPGRPVKSQIRQNIVEILFYLGESYGYKIAKIYNEVFPKVTQRSIYYHLRKGIQTKEIEVHKIEEEKGDFSWGRLVEKKYYSLGRFALPKGENKVREFIENYNKRCSEEKCAQAEDTKENKGALGNESERGAAGQDSTEQNPSGK